MLYLTGDTHGDNLARLSYGRWPVLRELGADDVLVILGDTGLMWPGFEGEASFTMRELACKPFTIVFLLGNHDNYDWAETLPEVDVLGGRMRQVVIDGVTYPNRYVVDSWTVADLGGLHCLLCAHAESHDIDHLYDEDDKEGILAAKRRHEWFRVAHKSWWPQEALDVSAFDAYMEGHSDEHFDAVLTHDAPSWFTTVASPNAGSDTPLRPTEGQLCLDRWRERLDFDVWAHGHFHYQLCHYEHPEQRGKRLFCLCEPTVSWEDLRSHEMGDRWLLAK